MFESIIYENYRNFTAFINELNDDKLNQQINYQNTKGEGFNNQLSDILTHVIYHGTHHRAQIGQHLKLAGLSELPVTDYITYLRDKCL